MSEYFTREQWFRLPVEFRRRWWSATDYGRVEPVDIADLLKEAVELLQAKKD
jgi:hypothetical protein